MVRKTFSFGYSETEYDKKELKFANLTFTMQARHVFQVLRGVLSYFYVLFPGSMLNHRPVWYNTRAWYMMIYHVDFFISVALYARTVSSH